MTTIEITEPKVRKIVETIRAGLSSGVGDPTPGSMCVEEAFNYGLGLPHGDDSPCIGSAVRSAMIGGNDGPWSSPQARAKGMLRAGVAQFGSNTLDQVEFSRRLAEKTIRVIVPIALRSDGELIPIHADKLRAAADLCEREGTSNAAFAAAARAAFAAAFAAAARAADAARDAVLSRFAELILEVLVEMESPGVKWLWLCDEGEGGQK